MFSHIGDKRTLKHNLKIASLLSFVAGIVNVAGFLSIQKLTTNVTGHFALFIDEVYKLNFWGGLPYLLYTLFFLLGSFFSNLLVEIISRKKASLIYIIPTLIESAILFFVSYFGVSLIHQNPNLLAYALLFAMGLQNSLVTTISNSKVRTTHLTGLFTDLGIELSQLFFYKDKLQKENLHSSIRLRLTIISFFFLGGIAGGIFYSLLELSVLAIAGSILILGIIIDGLNQQKLLKQTVIK